jgi:hypothetical protein
MVVALTTTMLDIYRILFRSQLDSKESAVARLTIQKALLENTRQQLGTKMLDSIIETLQSDKLNAAALLMTPAAGNA